MIVKATTVVTQEQIARCQRVVDESTMTPFYMVLSESDNLTEYKVEAIRRNRRWYFTCTCPAGLRGFVNCKDGSCKHVKWAQAANSKHRQEIAEQAHRDAEQAVQTVPPPAARWDTQARRESEGLYRSREAGRLAMLEAREMANAIFHKQPVQAVATSIESRLRVAGLLK